MARHVLVIDQGTTSTRSIIFDAAVAPVASAQQEFTQIYPRPRLGRARPRGNLDLRSVNSPASAEQRRTYRRRHRRPRHYQPTRDGGGMGPPHRASDPQCHRLAGSPHRRNLRRLEAAGHADLIAERTGLLLDPYFSATKIAWLLDNVDGARAAAEAGHLAFGTVDSFLLWRLTERRRSCDRRHQRLSDAAVRHPSRRLGSRSAGAVWRSRVDTAGGAGQCRHIR